MLDRALAISPNDSNIIAAKAETYMAAADLDKSWEMLRDLKFGPTDLGLGTVLNVLRARRDYDEAIHRINAMHESGNEPPCSAPSIARSSARSICERRQRRSRAGA